MVSSKVTIDVADVIARLNDIGEDVPSAMSRGLKDAAFQLRAQWRNSIAMDTGHGLFHQKPSRFTTDKGNVLVEPKKIIDEATVRVNDIQARYLNFIVRGLKRKGGDIATVRGQTLSPVKAVTKGGDLPGGPAHWLGTLKKKIKNADIISVHGRRAVYQRQRNGHLKLLAVFQKSIEYEDTLPLFEISDNFSSTFINTMNDVVNKLLR